jgi:chromosome partitioning protein
MKVIVVANQKGGVGKSTIACNLAGAYALTNKKVLLIDTDIQESSLSFRAMREKDDIKSISIKTPTIHKDIDSFINFDVIIVDAGGRDDGVFRSSILSAKNGLLIIPTLPSVYDLWATEDTLKILSEARVYSYIESYILINQVIKANIVKETEDTLKEFIKQYDIKILTTSLFSRVVYRNSIKEGKCVLEMNDKKAQKEIKNLIREINNIINIT